MTPPSPTRNREQGVALITTVIVVAVLAVVAVAMMQSTTVDRLSARSVANFTRAKLAAEAGAAVSQAMVADLIRRYPDSATVWQNIGGGAVAGTNNEATVLYVRAQSANTNLGASPAAFGPAVTLLAQPLVSRVGVNPQSVNTNLLALGSVVSSVPVVAGTSVNINLTNSSRPDPFVGSRSATNPGAPVTAAQWIYMTNSQGQTNARYAFWVEDESFKVNVNVATNGARGTTSLGLSPAEIRLDGSLQSSSNSAIRAVNAGEVIAARGSLGGAFPTASTAALAGGLTNAQASPEFRFLTSAHSRSLNLSRAGFKRFDINTLANGLPGSARANLDRFIAAITNSNSIPNFGQRFYRLATNSAGINNTSAVTAAHSGIYLQKIAANIIDYLDANDQPTVLSNTAGFPLSPAAKPDFGIEPAGGGTAGANPVAAFGVENTPRLQEYAIHGRILQMNPIGYETNSAPTDPKADYRISIDHYFEFWNPGMRDITLTNAFLKVYDQPRFGDNITGDLANEGRPFELQLGTVTFPAGRVTVLTTAPTNEINTSLISPASLPNVVSIPAPDDSHRIFEGETRDVSTNTSMPPFNRLFNVSMRARSTSVTDYESAVLLGNNQGILESFVGLPIVVSGGFVSALHFVVSSAAVQATIGNLTQGNRYFVRGGSLAGNSSATSTPSSREGDPRALNEQLEFILYQAGAGTAPDDQTRFFSSGLVDGTVPANSTIGAPNNNYVNPSNWVDLSSIAAGPNNAPLFVRNGALQTIGELGHLTDPARVGGTSPTVTNITYSRGGGRTLRIGQPEHPRWYDGNQTNASRTWTSWRLADIFTTTNALTITGAVNPNGIMRDGGAALRAALFDIRFQPSPEGATATANRAINTNNFLNAIIARMTNATAAGLPSGSVNVFWERGEISELPVFNSGNTLVPGVLMSNAFDRGREELVRRSIEMITTRGSVFTVYAIGQSLQTTATSTNVLSSCRVKTTFELIPQFANPSQAFDDAFAPANAASRFVAPTNYQVRIIATQYD
jgi:PilX N-terminal